VFRRCHLLANGEATKKISATQIADQLGLDSETVLRILLEVEQWKKAIKNQKPRVFDRGFQFASLSRAEW